MFETVRFEKMRDDDVPEFQKRSAFSLKLLGAFARALALLVVSLVPTAAYAQPVPERAADAGPASSAEPLSAFDVSSLPEAPRLFIIGHLRADPESPLDAAAFDRLRAFLLDLPSVREAMVKERVESIEIQSADSENVLVDWMNQEQVDLVFPPAMAFIRQDGQYDPVYQLSRPGRDIVSPSGDRVVHRGVVFVNNRSPLFRAFSGRISEAALREALPRYLAGRSVAFVSSYSAAGYYYPYIRLAELTSNTQPQSAVFCGSSEEVVKSVLNGVYEIGACDQGVIEKVLASGPPGLKEQRDKLLRVILETDAIPTDPVAFHFRWHPRTGQNGRPSPLGREIRSGIQAFFDMNRDLPRLLPSSDDRYDELEQSRERFNELVRDRESRTSAAPFPSITRTAARPAR